MVSVDDAETATGQSRAGARVGLLLAGDQLVLVESNVPSSRPLRPTDSVTSAARTLPDWASTIESRAGPADLV